MFEDHPKLVVTTETGGVWREVRGVVEAPPVMLASCQRAGWRSGRWNLLHKGWKFIFVEKIFPFKSYDGDHSGLV